jgi:photosystem II stability/assembly factor-like uncharacterized protein
VDHAPFPSGAIALTISPTDPDNLLLGAESGLFRSTNGGRDWSVEAPSLIFGSVLALTFATDGREVLISTSRALFRGEAGAGWREVPAPQGAAPARAIVPGSEPRRVYLAGWAGLYRSDDWGASWSSADDGLPREPVTALLIVEGAPETLYAVVQDGIWISSDGARNWVRRPADISSAGVDALTVDLRTPARLWAAGDARLFRSDDSGASWRRAGQPLPEPNTAVHGLAAREEDIVATTDRGLYRSIDGGEHWTPITDNLPAHLEAGPLVRDPADPASLYAGFSLIPYSELWRRAAGNDGAPVRLSVTSLMEGVAFLVLAAMGAIALLWSLRTYYRPPAGNALPKRRGMGGRQIEEDLLP